MGRAGGEECLFLISWNGNAHNKYLSLQPKLTYCRILFLSSKSAYRSFPLDSMRLWNDTLPARVSPASQPEVWWGCRYRHLRSACVSPLYIGSFIPSLWSIVQPWLVDWWTEEASNSQCRRGWDRTNPPSFLPQTPLFRNMAVVQSILPLELSFILEEWFEPRLARPHFSLSSLDWLIWQKQQNPYMQETKAGGGRRNMCVAPLPPLWLDYKATWPFLGAAWKYGSEDFSWSNPLTQQLHV